MHRICMGEKYEHNGSFEIGIYFVLFSKTRKQEWPENSSTVFLSCTNKRKIGRRNCKRGPPQVNNKNLGSFIRSTHPSHADYEKTKGDIDKKFLHSTADLKRSMEKFYLVDLTSGSPDINRNVLFW